MKSLTHRECEKFLRTNYTIRNSDFFDIDKIYDDYNTNHQKDFEIYCVQLDFKLDFSYKLAVFIKTDIYLNISCINFKKFFLHRINFIVLRGNKFSQIFILNIEKISDKESLSYEHYIKKPIHMFERRLNMIISRKPHLINALDISVNHPLIRKVSHITIIK